jgi:hypothetical protein
MLGVAMYWDECSTVYTEIDNVIISLSIVYGYDTINNFASLDVVIDPDQLEKLGINIYAKKGEIPCSAIIVERVHHPKVPVSQLSTDDIEKLCYHNSNSTLNDTIDNLTKNQLLKICHRQDLLFGPQNQVA